MFVDFNTQMSIIFSTLIPVIVLNIFFLVACYTDIRYMKIYDKFNILFLVARLLLVPIFPFSLELLLGGALFFLTFLIAAIITLDAIGGDIKFGGVLGLWLGFWPSFIVILLTVVINLAYRLVLSKISKTGKINDNTDLVPGHKKAIPLAPFFYISYLMITCYYFIF